MKWNPKQRDQEGSSEGLGDWEPRALSAYRKRTWAKWSMMKMVSLKVSQKCCKVGLWGTETAISSLQVTLRLHERKPGNEWKRQKMEGIANEEVYPKHYTRIGPSL